MRDVLIVPDLHAPYHHPDAFDFLRDTVKTLHRPRVVCIGDEADSHTLSRYDPDPELSGAAGELAAARETLRFLWKLFPRAVSCVSNHTWRGFKLASRCGLPQAYLGTIHSILEAPKAWRWQDRWDIDGVTYWHGDGFGGHTPQLAACQGLRRNSVIGHIHHAAGALWSHGFDDVVWGLSVGCLIDVASPAFSYARYQKHRPALGCGVIQDGVPRFVPLSPKYQA